MNERRIPIEREEYGHKKKSKKKGRSRADHKHEYKTVLLYSYFDNPFKQGEKKENVQVVEVCAICGRIGKVLTSIFCDSDEMKYDISSLEKWYVNDFFDKFAKKM